MCFYKIYLFLMKKNILLLVTFLFFIPEILADKRAPKGQCYISIGYVSDRDSVTEFAKKSFIKAKDFELFERKDKKVYLTLGKIDKNIFNKLESEGETYNFNCSSGKGYEERFGLNSEFQIVGGNKINIISAQQFMSVVSSIEIEKQRLIDIEVEKQLQARLAAEKEKQRLAKIEEQRKAEAAAEVERQVQARVAELEKQRKADEAAEKEKQRLAKIEEQRKAEAAAEKQRKADEAAEKEKQRLAKIEEQRKAERAAEIDNQIPNEASAKKQIKKDDSPLSLSSVKSVPTKYSCSNKFGFEDYTFNDEQRTAKIMTNFSDEPIIKEFKFLDKNKELIEINYPSIAKKYPSMSSRTVLNRVTGKKDAYSVEKLNNTVDCSIVAEETPEEKSQAARKAEDEKVITETRTKDELLKYISSKKWQVSRMPCTLNGGTYQLFSSQFKVGWNMAAQGNLIKETSNNASYTTEPIDGKTFRHEITIFSGGNQMVTNALGTPNAIISYSIDEYNLLDENTMQKTSIDNRQINFDLMLNGAYQLDNTSEIGKVTIVKACNL
jgi:hypothetical protein